MRVGDYVRTNDGYINKITSLSEWNVVVEAKKLIGEKLIIAKTEIINSNPRIIELIQVGDYVNGERVINIIKKHKYLEVSDEEIVIDEKDIKSIVTREMFESIEYRIGE